MPHRYALLLYSVGIVLLSNPLHAQTDAELYMPHIEFEAKKGNQRDLVEADAFMPLEQSDDSLLYMNLRVKADDAQSREGNFGVGYRQIQQQPFLGQRWLLGAYGYADLRRTKNNNSFVQATLGVEALSENFDVRANVYIPEKSEKQIAGSANISAAVTASNQLRLLGNENSRERALGGFDAEIGWKIPVLEEHIDAIRVYGGGFRFDGSGYDAIDGGRLRTEISWDDLPYLGNGSRFTLGAEAQHDDVRQKSIFGLARLRIPLGDNLKTPNRKTALQKRMTERVVRDVDIVSNSRTGEAVNESASVSVNGVETNNIIVLDANDDVPTEIAAAGADAVIILDGSAGIIDNGAVSVNVAQGQKILGGGLSVSSTTTGLSTTFGSRPTVEADAGVVAFNLNGSDNIVMRDLDIIDANNAVYSNSLVSNAHFSRLALRNIGAYGFELNNLSNSQFSDVFIEGANINAISLSSGGGNRFDDLSIENINGFAISSRSANDTFTDINISNSNAGISIFLGDYITMENLNVSVNTSTALSVSSSLGLNLKNSVFEGGDVDIVENGATVSNIQISNCNGCLRTISDNSSFTDIEITNSTSDAVEIGGDDGVFRNISINNAASGILINNGNNNTVSDISINTTTGNGVRIAGTSNGNSVSDVEISSAGGNGIILTDTSSNNTVSDFTISTVSGDGVRLASTLGNNISDFTVTNVSGIGGVTLFAAANDGASITNGTFDGGTSAGVLSFLAQNITLSDLTINGTAGSGLYLVNTTSATVNNVQINNATEHGIRAQNSSIGGANNTSTGHGISVCLDEGGNTGSIGINGGSCP